MLKFFRSFQHLFQVFSPCLTPVLLLSQLYCDSTQLAIPLVPTCPYLFRIACHKCYVYKARKHCPDVIDKKWNVVTWYQNLWNFCFYNFLAGKILSLYTERLHNMAVSIMLFILQIIIWINPHPCGRGLMQPPWVSLKWPLNCWVVSAEILCSLCVILCETFCMFLPWQVRSQNYNVSRGTAADWFFKEIMFSAT